MLTIFNQYDKSIQIFKTVLKKKKYEIIFITKFIHD